MQENTPKAVKEAVICVFTYNLQELAFVCMGGTHRSSAVAFLLAVLAYPAAEICGHTTRTIDAMREICTPWFSHTVVAHRRSYWLNRY